MKKKEAEEQIAIMNWAEYNIGRYKDLSLLYHTPNGGQRNSVEAKNLKRQGVKAGVPDLFLPVARGGYFGLFIELKSDKTCKASEHQLKWIDDLKEQGYMAGVCYGAEHAIRVLERYLSQPRTIVLKDAEQNA